MLKDADNYYADTVIHCMDGDIKCHKSLICKRSEYFNNMINANMKEGRSGHIKMPKTEKEVCYTVIEFIYSDVIEANKIDLQVLMEADKMGLLKLKEKCTNKFIKAR